VPVERCVALLARVTTEGGLVTRGSFFQRDFVRKQRDAGLPMHLIAHEDVVVLTVPGLSSSRTDHSAQEPARPRLDRELTTAAGGTTR
jgi:hypothetical protein